MQNKNKTHTPRVKSRKEYDSVTTHVKVYQMETITGRALTKMIYCLNNRGETKQKGLTRNSHKKGAGPKQNLMKGRTRNKMLVGTNPNKQKKNASVVTLLENQRVVPVTNMALETLEQTLEQTK